MAAETIDRLFAPRVETLAAFCARHPHAFLVRPSALQRPDREQHVFSVRARHVWSRFASVVVGRGRECDVVVRGPRVSRRHAVFERNSNNGGYVLVDLGSTNGTRVAGTRLPAGRGRILTSGELIELGGLALLFLDASDLFARLARYNRMK